MQSDPRVLLHPFEGVAANIGAEGNRERRAYQLGGGGGSNLARRQATQKRLWDPTAQIKRQRFIIRYGFVQLRNISNMRCPCHTGGMCYPVTQLAAWNLACP